MKVPATPPDQFTIEPQHLRTYGGVLWRVYRTSGAHAVVWSELRHFGPVPKMRFDPQPPPPATYPNVGVMYTATGAVTALAETYQQRREITRDQGGAAIVAWQPSRVLTLLDLTTNWPVLNGAAASIMMGPKRHTQAWARAIDERHGGEIDGLYSHSAITNQPVIALFSRTERVPAFPTRVRFNALLSDVTADYLIELAVEDLDYKSLRG